MADIAKLTANLEKRGFRVSHYATAAEATAALSAQIQDKTVGMGGSKTLEDMGLFELLSAHNTVSWHWKQPRAEAQAASARAQVYLTSANGVAETGEIVNIDGTGNRVAAMLDGKESVYIIIGVNKIAPDFAGALHRARNIAAPLNARRLGKQTPCAVSDPPRCHDCAHPERICNGLTVLWRKMGGVGMCEVVIIDEELGY